MFIDAATAAAIVVEEFGIRMDADELGRLARTGFGPPYRKLDGRKRLYRADDVRAWAGNRLGPLIVTRDTPAFSWLSLRQSLN